MASSPSYIPYLCVAAAAFITTFLTVPLVKRLAIKLDAVDYPSKRRINTKPIPRLGGTAVFLGLVVACIVQILGTWYLGWPPVLVPHPRLHISYPILALSFTVIFATGAIDDVFQLKPKQKLAGQVLAALIACIGGLRIGVIVNPFAPGEIMLGWLAYPITVIYLVAFTNIINLIDGLDGLATGICGIASFTMFSMAVLSGRIDAAALSIALFGACLAFYYVYDMSKVSLNSKVELTDDEDKEKKVYTLNRLSAEDALNFAQDFFKKLGTTVDKSNIDTYDNQILYSSSDGRYKIMVYLNGGAYSFTDFNCSDNVINQNMDKESVIAALKKYNVKPCDIAEFEQEREDGKKLSSYRFYVDLNEKNNKLTDGYLTISQSNKILNIYNYIYTYKSYGKYKIISQEEAYDKIKAGQFNSYELYNIKSILIRSIKLCYQLDSKGYYQPVYRFECTIDGEGRPIFIPALEEVK